MLVLESESLGIWVIRIKLIMVVLVGAIKKSCSEDLCEKGQELIID